MKRVLLLLAKGFETLEASAFIDVIGWNLIEGDGTTQLFTCGLEREIKTSFDQQFTVDYLINEIDTNSFDALAIPGGFEKYGFYEHAFDERFLNLIRTFDAQGKNIASICVGALPIARSGVLVNRNATTYNRNPVRQDVLRSCQVNLVNEPLVIDGNIITSWNPSTALDVAFLLLERLTSPEQCISIKQLMGFC